MLLTPSKQNKAHASYFPAYDDDTAVWIGPVRFNHGEIWGPKPQLRTMKESGFVFDSVI